MHGVIHKYFTDDHRRLEVLMNQATMTPDEYEMTAYGQFRRGLLKHIKMEETIIFPALEKSRSGVYSERIAKLRLDHGALTALMVPPPSPTIVNALRFILAAHNQLEEESKGLYDLCDEYVQDAERMLLKIEQIPDVPVLPHKTEPFILEATRRAVSRAGYDFDQLANTSIPKNNNLKDE
jgi:hypothetical protein